MNEPEEMFERQAAWQRARRRLPWPVKIRMAELARDAVRQLRKTRAAGSGSSVNPPSAREPR